MTRRILAAAAVLLLFIPGVVGDWNQFGGDPGKSGVAELPAGPLDVLDTFDLLGDDLRVRGNSLHLVDTPHGPMFLAEDRGAGLLPNAISGPNTQCHLLRLDLQETSTEEITAFPCLNGGKLLGYDPIRDLLFLSIEDGDPDRLLRIVNAADGTELWATGPTLVVPASPGVGDQLDWWVDDLVIDEEAGLLYVPFGSDGGRQRIEAIDIDARRSLWQTSITIQTGIEDFGVAGEGVTRAPLFASVTQTQTGLIVLLQRESSVSVAWLGFDGNQQGEWGLELDELLNTEATTYGSQAYSVRAAAQGSLGVAHIGGQLLYIDPDGQDPNLVPLPITSNPVAGGTMPALVWTGDHVLVPLAQAAFVHDTTSGEISRWPGYPGGPIAHAIGTPDGDALAVIPAGFHETSHGALVQIDLDQARTVHVLPLPDFHDPGPLVPLADPERLLAWGMGTGNAALLGPAPGSLKPAVDVTTRYPALGQIIQLQAPEMDVDHLLLAWGDGALERLEPGSSTTRAFDEPGRRTLRLTAVYEDGRTGTTEMTLFVGEDPPRDLNFIQEAFDPENYDLTFGVLGILIALFGGLFALYRHQRGRSRIARELQALEKAYGATKNDPIACETALAERKARARGLFADGKLNETQFAVLDRRIDELGSQHRMEAIEDRFAFLSVGMARTLREMLADGRISDWERDHFIEALEQDNHLTKGQKTKVRKQVETWFNRDAGNQA